MKRPPRNRRARWGLRIDPIPWLRSSDSPALALLLRRDLLDEPVDAPTLWTLPEPTRLVRRQQTDGSWRYPRRRPGPENFELLETFRALGILVAQHAFDRRHEATGRAAAYVFSCQSAKGDYRGIYGNQPAHTYTAALMELLIEAGYDDHRSIERAFQWLLATRQDDGGWAIPLRTRDVKSGKRWEQLMAGPEIEPDRSRPFSHLVTGMALRAFAAHPRYRESEAARHGGRLLLSRLFRPDRYVDRRSKEYWTKFSFPFWFTDLISALDTLGRLGFTDQAPEIGAAVAWLRARQEDDGSFVLPMLRDRDPLLPHWIGFALCRALKRVWKSAG